MAKTNNQFDIAAAARKSATEQDTVELTSTPEGKGSVFNVFNPQGNTTIKDDEFSTQARAISDSYKSMAAADVHRSDLLPPVDPKTSPYIDIANIFAHDEMALFGIKLDEEGFHFDMERSKDFWSEHPIRAGVAVALGIVPGLAAATKPFRVGKFANLPTSMLVESGLVDGAIEVGQLAAKDISLLQRQAYSMQRMTELTQKIDGGTASVYEKAMYNMQKTFGNSYMEKTMKAQTNPVETSKEWYDRMKGVVTGKAVSNLLDSLPDEKHGTAIVKFLNDPAELKNIPVAARPWAMRYADRAREIQRQGIDEGFVSEGVAAKVGDIWFSTLRKGSKLTDEGITTSVFQVPRKGKKGNIELLNIPRTTSPHLLGRKTTKEELKVILNRQGAAEALDAGDKVTAVRLLKANKGSDSGVIRAIETGNEVAAKGTLGMADAIDTAPANLTVKSLIQQELLLENFRYIRDISMNRNYAKTAEEVASLGPKGSRKWIDMDANLPNAHIVRRMIGVKQGTGPAERLGFIHEDIFKQLTDGAEGQAGVARNMVDFVEVMTAIHKTSKTALNPFTHGQNVIGNYVFLAMAGFNPLSKTGHDLIWKKALPAVWKMQRGHRAGRSIDDMGDLGGVRSKIGGPDVDIATELARPEVADIIEKTSLLADEGIGVLHRLSKRAGDPQTVVKGIIKGAQGAVKNVPGLEKAIDAYMAEDAMVKLAYFLDLRSRGLSPMASALEVSRRLPMYNTIGSTPKQLRKHILPWVSFPAESMRIMKNNMMDKPLSTMMWFNGVKALQALTYPALDSSAEGIRETKEGLPLYAQKPSGTLITPIRDSNDDLRAATLDALPWLSVLPPTESKHAGFMEKLPMGMSRPMPILEGLVQALTGRGSYGQEVPTEPGNVSQIVAKTALGMAGFIMPPLVQKYGMNISTPSPFYRGGQDIGTNVNPYTTKPGDPMFDMFVNNIGGAGLFKMYASSPEQQLANESLTMRAIQNYRGHLTRNWNAYMRSGNWQEASEVMADIARTYDQEYHDPAVSSRKWVDWLSTHRKSLKRHPQFKSFSDDKLKTKLRELAPDMAMARSHARAGMIGTIRNELNSRGADSAGGTMNPLMGGAIGGGIDGGIGGGISGGIR